MLNDSEQTSETPEVRHWLHLFIAFIGFMPSALYVLFIAWFMRPGPEKMLLWAIVAVCLIALIVTAFTSLYGLAYVAAAAPLPLLFLIAAILSGPTTRKWTEDVLLDDGSIIQVKRMVKFKESNSLSGDAYNAVETDAMISFTGDLKELPPWRVPLMPIVMYQDKGTKEWVVVAMTTSTDVWHRHGRPCPKYWEYRLNDGGWHKVPLSPASIGRPANLLHRYQSKLGTGHITIQDRGRRESEPGIGERFKKIISAEEAGCAAHQPNS